MKASIILSTAIVIAASGLPTFAIDAAQQTWLTAKTCAANAKLERWKNIHWFKNADAALAEAQRQHKPILVVFSVGAQGKANASEC